VKRINEYGLSFFGAERLGVSFDRACKIDASTAFLIGCENFDSRRAKEMNVDR
jgi:hypothetical protein